MIDVRSFAVGPIQENTYLIRASSDSSAAILIDPGEEPQRLLDAAAALGVKIEAILLTHCHFDHIGAVAPIAKVTGAPVYCPEIEKPLLTDVMRWVPPGFGPFESWDPEHTLTGGEHLQIADLQIEVLFTPGHSPGHLTYAIGADRQGEGAPALLSGDVLFKGSVGRVDLPGGDWPTLQSSIAMLMQRFPAESVLYPGHMGITTLGAELQANPFLTELRQDAALALPADPQRTSS